MILSLSILLTIFSGSVFTLYYLIIRKGLRDADNNNINNIEVTFTEVKNK